MKKNNFQFRVERKNDVARTQQNKMKKKPFLARKTGKYFEGRKKKITPHEKF